jgi:nicotinamidase/pyrazinamidase
LDIAPVAAVFSKGEHSAAYSGFEGTTRDGTWLGDWLHARDVRSVDVVGIATDHCVRATALDAARAGLRTTVLLDLTAGVTKSTVDKAMTELDGAGVTLIGSPVVGQ